MSPLTIPNFFLAGAPKAGTTSLYRYLNQHPDIFMSPVKEPSYFAFEARPENFVPELQGHIQEQIRAARNSLSRGMTNQLIEGVICSWEDYLKLFAGARGERVIGEASVCYLWSRTAAREIAARSPAAKFLLILRHPAERAFSQYLHYLSDGHPAHSFGEHIAKGLKSNGLLSPYHPFLEFGFYGEQVQRLLSYFPQEQVLIWLYEDTLATPQEFLRAVFSYLEVDTSYIADTSRRDHQMEIPRTIGLAQHLRRRGIWRTLQRWTPTFARPWMKSIAYRRRGSLRMSAEDRRFLVEYYRNDVKRLEHVLGRDLRAWLQ